jgi:hypothetical protein
MRWKLTLELLLGLDDGDQVLATTGVVVDSGGQALDVRVDGLEVGLGGGSITGDEGSSGRDGEENDVGDGNHFGGVVVFWWWKWKKMELIVEDVGIDG